MKNLLCLFVTFIIILSCDQQKDKKIVSKTSSNTEKQLDTQNTGKKQELEVKKDTIHNYWELILDTITQQEGFKILDKNYTLELKTFSLNDSAIVRSFASYNYQKYLDYSHTMVTDFKLTTDSTITKKRIERTDFEKYLYPEFYAECNLFSTEVDSIIENIIHLKTDLAVPDSDNQWRVWYFMKVIDDQLGNIEFKDVDYIGL